MQRFWRRQDGSSTLRVVLALLAAWFGTASIGSALELGHRDHPDCVHCVSSAQGRKSRCAEIAPLTADAAAGDPPLGETQGPLFALCDFAPIAEIPSFEDLEDPNAADLPTSPTPCDALIDACPARAPPSPR